MKLLKFFKQLFCFHKWEEFIQFEETENIGGMLSIADEVKYRKCINCGKIERC